MSGQLATDPLFVGLTRPSMIFGVSIQYAMLNMMVSVTIFIQKSSVYIIFIALVVHMIGYLLCFKEPRFMELLLCARYFSPPLRQKRSPLHTNFFAALCHPPF